MNQQGRDFQGPRLACLGGGNMAQAILLRALDAGTLDKRGIVVADPDEVKREVFARKGVQAVANFADLAGSLAPDAQVLLAVKPQILPHAADSVRAAAGPPAAGSRVVISILAGTTSEGVRRLLGDWARVVRVMPNTPARIGKGIAAITLGAGAKPGDDDLAASLLGSVGQVVRTDESLFDAFTALAGSGPAYVFYLAEAMTRAAQRMGFDDQTADTVVRATIDGAASLLAESADQSPLQLREAVTSRGGTTAAATRALDDANTMELIIKAIERARDRGRELSEG